MKLSRGIAAISKFKIQIRNINLNYKYEIAAAQYEIIIIAVLTAVQVSLTPTHLFPSRLNFKKIKLSISNCCNPLVSQ